MSQMVRISLQVSRLLERRARQELCSPNQIGELTAPQKGV